MIKNFLIIIQDFFSRFFKKKTMLEKLISKHPEAKQIAAGFIDSIETGFFRESLYMLLLLMSLAFRIDKDFRRNIQNFNGRYLFSSSDGRIQAGVIFKNGRMKVEKNKIDDTHVVLTFRDVQSVMNFVMSGNPSILNAVLDQTIVIDGNMNYIYKFAYMAQNLVIRLKQWLKD